mmetsp:Transcript_26285/g.75814  ORF Transcript_26285/g.75814 Transcript_26285/m.75814 type:complete len:256 (+) Transcript_26285:142-909(+)
MSAVRIDRLALNEEGDIRQRRVVDEFPQVVREAARRNGHGLKSKLVKVVEHDAAVVAPEHIQRVVENLRDQGRPPTRRILRGEGKPCLAIEAELVEIVQSLLPAVAPEEEKRVAIHHAGVKVSRRRDLPNGSHRGPRPRCHPELVEIVHPMDTIVATKKVHGAVVNRPRWTTPPRWDEALHLGRAPHPALKVEVEHIIQPSRPVVPAEHVHEIAVYGGDVPEACRGDRALVPRRYCLPGVGLEAKRMQVVQPCEA